MNKGEKTKKVTTSLPLSMCAEIEEIAERRDRSVSYVLAQFIEEGLEDWKAKVAQAKAIQTQVR